MGLMAIEGMEIGLRLLLSGFFFCFIGLAPQYSNAAERSSITQGDRLLDWEYLVSARGIFRLGFFSPGSSKQRYLGIWYNKDPYNEDPRYNKRTAWVANRDTPISDSSGVLTIDADGRLKITYSGGSSIYLSYPSNQTARNPTATLLDSGNFVMSDMNSNRSGMPVLWQSFDYPTDALLPGMKLGLNVKTGHKWSLTSWITEDDPGSGTFTLGSDPKATAQLFVWRRRGEVNWKSGLWLNNKSFVFYPSFGRDPYSKDYNFSYVSNADEKYFTYSVTDDLRFAMLVMDYSGQILQERTSVGPFGACDYSQPQCVGLTLPQCRVHDRFVGLYGFMNGEPYQNEGDPNMALVECKEKCLTNCSCIAYASANDNGTGCQLWNRGRFEQSRYATKVVYKLAHRRIKWWIWFIIAIAAAVVIIASCNLIWRKRRRKLRQRGEVARQRRLLLELGANTTADQFMNTNKTGDADKKGPDVKIFSFSSILAATHNFSPENKLGQGGFGPVYKGMLLNGQEIAVKRLSRSSGQGLEEFKNEIVLIAKLQHMNLVRLLGCCIEGEEKMLIYEYMPNKSLDFFLFDPVRKELLDWKRRLSIIEGIAQGLLYLHKYSRLRVIHRDLKAGNVLLDNDMNPKISDFGLARIFEQNESQANTNRPAGTYGYMSPEYVMEGIFSMKSDVYSFGVLLLEIVSGRKNSSFYHFERPTNLIGYTWELWREGKTSELLDPSLVASCQQNEPLRLIHIGLLCVQGYASDRPSMSDVVSMLTTVTMPLPPPKQPTVFAGRSMTQADTASRKTEKCSINGASLSTMDGR